MQRRALIIRFSSLGDVTLTLPSVEFLSQQGFEVHYLTKEAFAPLVRAHGVAHQIHTISNHARLSELRAKAAELRGLQFSRVYDLHRNIRSFLVTRILRGPETRTVSKFRIREFLAYFLKEKGCQTLGLEPPGRSTAALRLVGGPAAFEPRPFQALEPLSDEITSLLRGLPEKGTVCVAAESAWDQKQWPWERFIEVARALIERGYGVVWLGLKPIPAAARLHGSLDLTGKLTIDGVAGVLSRCRLLVCNDSGLLHIAEAQGVPVVAIFGPTTRDLGFGPRLARSQLVEAPLWCRPCSKTGRLCIRPFQRRKCLQLVSTAAVLRAVEAIEQKP